ncbi:MAG: hypothetical protein IKP14_01160 [Clostridiales bacterium]|jgi:hypothetical protein|nr:hypothetical protein [Clostridiales bacterium]
MNSNVRRPSIAVSSVSSSIEGKESVGDVLRKAKKELIFKRICIGMVLIVLATLIVYLCVSGYIPDLIDGFFALIE